MNRTPLPSLRSLHQIVQKLHACTLPDTEQWINDRAHDLVDLQLALRVYDGSLADLRDIATRLFAARRQHAWPPEVTKRERWADRYAAEAHGLDVLDRSIVPPAFERAFESYVPRNQRAAQKTAGERSGTTRE